MIRQLGRNLISLNLAVVAIAMAQKPRDLPSTNSHVIVLGVGSPVIDSQRAGTGIAIAAGDTLYVFDAGPGVLRRLMEAQTKLAGWKIRQFGPLFLTHLHMDHTLDVPALYRYHLFTPDGRLVTGGESFTVYGPPRVDEFMNHVRAAFGGAIAQAADAHVWNSSEPPYHDSNVTIKAFRVQHKDESVIGPAVGYRIETSDRVIVISGDTRPVDATVEACNGCDILFHEVFGLAFGPQGPTGPATGHTSAAELGDLARRAKPKLLVLYHTLGDSTDALIARIKSSFGGPVRAARDLDDF
jgi:ribonuclease BN (tRNA processing enzyme)